MIPLPPGPPPPTDLTPRPSCPTPVYEPVAENETTESASALVQAEVAPPAEAQAAPSEPAAPGFEPMPEVEAAPPASSQIVTTTAQAAAQEEVKDAIEATVAAYRVAYIRSGQCKNGSIASAQPASSQLDSAGAIVIDQVGVVRNIVNGPDRHEPSTCVFLLFLSLSTHSRKEFMSLNMCPAKHEIITTGTGKNPKLYV